MPNEHCRRFIDYLKVRIRSDESVKEYVDLAEREKTSQLIRAVSYIEENHDACYIREFSIRCFGDSFEAMDVYGMLAEYYICHTLNYVYVKGDSGVLKLVGTVLVLSELKQGQ